jgi:hypothetical protein
VTVDTHNQGRCGSDEGCAYYKYCPGVVFIYTRGEREKARGRGVGAPFKRKRKNSNSLTAFFLKTDA